MNNKQYILSVWKNHSDIKQWHFDICPVNQYFKNSIYYITQSKEPYYFTPLFYGTENECQNKSDLIKDFINKNKTSTQEELENYVKAVLCL